MSTGLSAIQALEKVGEVVAHHVANVNTPGYQPQRARTEESLSGGVTLTVEQGQLPIDTVTLGGLTQKVEEPANQLSLEDQMVTMMANQRSYEANVQAVKAADAMQTTLFDLFG
jgi:flagellar basal-body rod protein FlgC